MEDLLIEILESFGYPVFLQGSLAENEPYPDDFFTFWDNGADGTAFYDNDENAQFYSYDVNFYSCDPSSVYETLRETKKRLKAAGFGCFGDAHTVASDQSTHDGRGIDVTFLKG